MEDKSIFVVDIGTRSVIAVTAELRQDKLVVNHMAIKEHESRAMIDGQIERFEKDRSQLVTIFQEYLDKF